MPTIDTYTGSSATARELQRLSLAGDIRNVVTFNASWLDGATDVTDELNDACVALRAAEADQLLSPLILPPGKYLISDTIAAQRVPIIAPWGATILAQSVGAGKPAISWAQTNEARIDPHNGPLAANLAIRGRNTVVTNTPTYTAGAVGIRIGAPTCRFENLTITNFDRAVEGASYAYLVELKNVRATYGKYGLYWPLDCLVAGERISFVESNLSNNEEGFYINHNITNGAGRSGSFYFERCSLDYNTVRHGQIIGPTTSTNDLLTDVVLSNCHIETANSTTPNTNPRITNAANLALIGCHIYENEITGGYASIIDNPSPGRCSLVGNYWGLEGTAAWCTGNGEWRAVGNRQRYSGTVNITASVADAAA